MQTDPTTSTELHWAQRPMGELVRLSWPIAVSMLSYSTMTLVDTLFVGRLGPAALAGVGLGGVLAFAAVCFSIGLLRSVKVLVSQAVGAGRPGDSVSILGGGLLLAGVLGFATLALGLAATPLVGMIGGTEAADYFAVRMVGTPLLLAYTALREARYGLGDSRSPMRAALLANLANVGLNALFIYVLELGVIGSAWATVLAGALEAGLLWLGQRPDGFGLRTGRRHVRELMRLGVPTGLQFLLEVGSFTLLAALIARMGEVQMAAHQIAVQLLHFCFLPAFAVGEAASVLAGQAVGAGRWELVRAVGRRSLKLTLAYAAICGAVFLGAGAQLVAAFTDEPELARAAVALLAVGALFQVLDGANIVARGVLRGTGDVRFPAVVGVITAWICTPPLTWLLGVHFGLGAMGGWLGLAAEISVGAAIFWWRLERQVLVRPGAAAVTPLAA